MRRGPTSACREFLYAKEVAALAGMTDRNVLTLAKAGTLASEVVDTIHRFPLAAVGAWLRSRQDRAEARAGTADLRDEKDRQSARKDAALAEKAELENAVRRGELMEAEDVIAGWQDILTMLRTRLLQVPVIATPLVVGESDAHAVRQVLDDAIRDALTELSAPDLPDD